MRGRPTIAVDVTAAAVPEPTGVAVYLDRLARALPRIDPETRFLLCYRLSKLGRRALVPAPTAPNARRALFDDRIPLVRSRRIDLFHGADIRLARGPWPKVATVHDLYSLTSPEPEDPRFVAKRVAQYERAACEARAIVCHSEHVAREVRRRFSLPEERVVVVPLGVDPEMRPLDEAEAAPVAAWYGVLARPYVLAVGLISRRKNAVGAVRALARARARGGPPLDLVLAGREGGAGEAVRAEAARAGLADAVRAVGYVPRRDLPALYSRARALIMLSLDEGFGLPALEAMACGTPVVAARRAALPEVAGEAAVLVDPEDADAAGDALLEAVAEGSARAARIAAGRARAARFAWEETARRTLAVYRRVLAEAAVEAGPP